MPISNNAFNKRSHFVLNILQTAQSLTQLCDLLTVPLSRLLRSFRSDTSAMLGRELKPTFKAEQSSLNLRQSRLQAFKLGVHNLLPLLNLPVNLLAYTLDTLHFLSGLVHLLARGSKLAREACNLLGDLAFL
jgi:hypothetical protein